MKEKKKDYLFMVRTIKNSKEIPEGSGIYVRKETKKYYIGDWSSSEGTFEIKVLKDKCKKLDKL